MSTGTAVEVESHPGPTDSERLDWLEFSGGLDKEGGKWIAWTYKVDGDLRKYRATTIREAIDSAMAACKAAE